MHLTIIEKELLADEVNQYTALFDKTVKRYKEKDVVINTWQIKISNYIK